MPSDQPPPEPTNPEPQVPPPAVEPPIDEPRLTAEAEPEAPVPPRVRTKPTLPPDFVDETLPETGLRLLKQAVQNAQPILKGVTVKALRSTISLLETTVDRLEAEPQPPVPPSPTIAGDASQPGSAGLTGAASSRVPASAIGKAQGWWASALSQVRSRLPLSLNQKLNDQALTGAIVGILVVLVWTTSAVLPSKSKPPEVAVAPPAAVAPSPQPVPPQVKAPAPPVPVSPTPQPKPTPALQLSPEQKLIASIQDQVAEVSDRYSSSLIRSVQANFRSSRLVVKLGDSWYGLSETQQNKLSNELLKRAQQLDFVKLELSDPEGVLLARSPVVGSEMIILKRTTATEVEETA